MPARTILRIRMRMGRGIVMDPGQKARLDGWIVHWGVFEIVDG